MIRTLLCDLLFLYLVVLWGRIILSWFPIQPDTGMAALYGVLYTVTEPVLAPVRRVMPGVGGGGMVFDLSPLVVSFAILLLRGAICG